MTLNEAQIIGVLAEIFGSNHRGVQVGIGDDAAVVATGKHTVITTDMAVEGTHFNCEWSGAFEIGRKITAANLADIYAMGATPKYLLVAAAITEVRIAPFCGAPAALVLPNIEGITPPRPIAKKYLAAAFWNASSPANKLVTTSSAMTTTISGDTYSAAKLNKTAESNEHTNKTTQPNICNTTYLKNIR